MVSFGQQFVESVVFVDVFFAQEFSDDVGAVRILSDTHQRSRSVACNTKIV